jgi:hypothetical protein
VFFGVEWRDNRATRGRGDIVSTGVARARTHLRQLRRLASCTTVPRRKPRIWLVAAAIVLIIAIGGMLAVFAPFLRSPKNFLALAGDARVRYEPGAEAAAATIARALPEAIATVERGQFSRFVKPVEVYVCASTDTFERYGHRVAGAGGFVLNGRLFISPKEQNTTERLPRLLVHELSHLHLDQQLGTLTLTRRVPNWFKEGLAVYVSLGAGAENVTETQARDSILAGRLFRRDLKGNLLSPQTGARDGLAAHMFYRQSALFVEFLAGRGRTAFERLMAAIQRRQKFAAAVVTAYGTDIDGLWQEFSRGLQLPAN